MGQLLVEGGEPARNLARAADLIAQAASENCDLVLLPETLDFAWTHPSALHEAQPIPGPFSAQLCAAAAQHGLYVCAGLTERAADGRNYNAAILIDPQGQIILKYHKINLLSVEQPFYAVGQTLNVVDTPLGKIGVNICADNYLDALPIGHTLARMGAEFIIAPASWTVEYRRARPLPGKVAKTVFHPGPALQRGGGQYHFGRLHCGRALRGQKKRGLLAGR